MSTDEAWETLKITHGGYITEEMWDAFKTSIGTIREEHPSITEGMVYPKTNL